MAHLDATFGQVDAGRPGIDLRLQAGPAFAPLRTCSVSPSERSITAAAVRSPVTLTVVRHMSRIRSTPSTSAIPAAGSHRVPASARFSTSIEDDDPGRRHAGGADRGQGRGATMPSCAPNAMWPTSTCAMNMVATAW